MSTLEIQKVKLHKTKKGEGLVITFEKGENGGDTVTGVETHKAIIHKDLKKAINGLGIHLAIMTGYVNSNDVEIIKPDPKQSEKFHVNGYSLGGDDDNAGIVISGHHILNNGLAVILNTPFSRFDIDPKSRYVFMDDLQKRVADIEAEIGEYLDGNKRGEPVQQELALGGKEEKVTKMKIAAPEKVSPEAKLASGKDHHKYAGKEQMAGVAGLENGSAKKNGPTKKVKQTAENPSGIITE